MKKISILALHLGYGGIEKCIVNLANALCENYDIEIAVCYKLYDKPSFDIDKRVKIKYLNKDIVPNKEKFMEACRKKNPIKILKEGFYSVKVLYARRKSMVNYIENKKLIHRLWGVVRCVAFRPGNNVVPSNHHNMAKVIETNIESLVPDNKNFNKGTQYGDHLMDESLRRFGLGRSILIDKNNRIIAGNKTAEKAADIGFTDVVVVEVDGNQLVAVKRKDIDLDSAKGRELALADNATGKANLAWDEELISAMAEKWDFEPGDWGVEIPDGEEESQPQGKEEQETGAIEVRCKPGDIWQLGNHRLMCGDSIDLEQVKQLLGGGKN